MVTVPFPSKNRRQTQEEARREAATNLSESLRVASQQVVLLTQLPDFPSEEKLAAAKEALETIEICLKNARVSTKTVRRNLR